MDDSAVNIVPVTLDIAKKAREPKTCKTNIIQFNFCSIKYIWQYRHSPIPHWCTQHWDIYISAHL